MSFKKYFVLSLLEGKLDDVNEKHYDISDTDKQRILQSIPHQNAQHYDWALRQHAQTPVDTDQLKKTLTAFNTNKDKLGKKNIHQYKSFDELKNAVSNFQEKPKESTTLYDSPTMKVEQHHTYHAAIKAAKLQKDNPHCDNLNGKATWCISADSDLGQRRYNQYTKNGHVPFYTIEDKTNSRKYALVASPLVKKSETELRDENDKLPNVPEDDYEYDHQLKKDPTQNHVDLFSKNHPEIMKTPLHDFFTGKEQDRKAKLRSRILSGEYTDKDVDEVFNDPTESGTRFAMAHSYSQDIKKHHIEKFMNDYYPKESSTADLLTSHEHLTPEHINKVLKYGDGTNTRKVLTAPNVNSDNIRKALETSSDYKTRVAAITHPKATQEDYKRAIDNPNYETSPIGNIEHLSSHIHPHDMSEDTLNHYFKSRNVKETQKVNAIKNNLFITKENIDTAYRYGFRDSKIAALQHPLASNELLQHAMKNGGTETIRNAATEEYNKRVSK